MITITVDTSRVTRGMRQLETALPRVGPRVGFTQAVRTADRIRSGVPVRSGRLRSTVTAQKFRDGGGVTYGGGLPYASYIEGRSHAVEHGTAGAPAEFEEAMTAAAEQEIDRL